MDALTRHRMLALAGVPGLRPLVEIRAEEPEDVEEIDEEDDLEDELDEEDEESDEDESDDFEDEELDDEDPGDQGELSPEPAARDRQLRLLGVELRAARKSNPRPGRQVVSAEGMKQYGLPIGADILPGMRKLTALQQQAVEALRTSSPEAYGRYVAERRQGKTHTDAMKSAGVPAKKATPAKAAKATPAKATPPRKGTPAREALDKRLARRYTSGESIQQIADAEGVSASLVHQALTSQGVQLRPRGGVKAAPAKKATPRGQDLTGARGLSTDAAVREVQIENRIRAAYARAQKRPGGTVNLADLRNELGEASSRREIDEALTRMGREPGASVLPNENRKELTRVDREAAVRIGPVDYHFLVIEDGGRLRPLPPAAPAKKATPPAPGVPEGFGLAPGPAADRQRRIDRARTVGEALSEVDELASNEASPKAFEARLRIQARRGGLTDAQVDELVAAASFGSNGRVSSQDRQQLWQALDRIAEEHGLQRLSGRAGDSVYFDPEEHEALGDRDLRGKIVEVVRPGYAIVDDDPPSWSNRAPGERLVIVRSVVHDTLGSPAEGITEGQFLRDLAAKRPTLPALRKLAADVDLDVPDDVSRSRRKFEQFLAQHREHPGLLAALAAMPAGAEGFDPEPIAAEIVTLDNEAAIIARLSGITSAAQMRRVATAINLPVPASLRTAVQIREYIAREVRRDRTRWSLRSAEARHRTLQLLGIAEERADINPKPGDNNLRNYWVYGKGRARWNTFTELRRHLLEHVGPQRADRIAAEWFHLRYGFWPGDDRNRVRQGKPPRGKRIGPG